MSSFSTTTHSHWTETVSNFQSNFLSGSTQGKSVLPLPTGERRSGGLFPFQSPLAWNFPQQQCPIGEVKRSLTWLPRSTPCKQPGLKATTTDNKFPFFPILLRFYWAVHVLPPHTAGLMHLHLFLPLCVGGWFWCWFFSLMAVTQIWAQGTAKTQWGRSLLVLVMLLMAAFFWLGLILEIPRRYGCSNQTSQEERKRLGRS